VWQNFIIPNIPSAYVQTVSKSLVSMGFPVKSSPVSSGVIACTGSRYCKYAQADTKGSALELIKHLEKRVKLDQPVNIHFTGCPHSCAQHYCGDIGFVGAKLADGSEGYHVVLGGGMDHEQGIAREIFKGVRAVEVNALVEKIIVTFEAKKQRGETFAQWTRRHSTRELQEFLSA
jgi:ferredoxin-nitrite reductase